MEQIRRGSEQAVECEITRKRGIHSSCSEIKRAREGGGCRDKPVVVENDTDKETVRRVKDTASQREGES